ncbi:hypothetical protein G3O08_14135 [Cryomorpha ignava]|uniref:PKD/Chitinase domain-containing protein n=1 Tax=Cryomorpha ignava TaxID=101383 RepID=A0A7K3WUQ5_9FLAO|nr:gliding motility-associated C-terminal domain-containing protein [Cryomorpha ignava]NEN24642.1 hypothetical protein [Cryomorpha ignava]
MKWILFLTLAFFLYKPTWGQNLFVEECFVGGVTVAGRTSLSITDGFFKIKWENNYSLKAAYALSYRFRSPPSTEFMVNDNTFIWDSSNQFGDQQAGNISSDYFAVNVLDITNQIEISSDSCYVYMNGIDYSKGFEQAYYSLEFVFLYESPSISDTTCLRIYTASQPQYIPQNYSFVLPDYNPYKDVGFSIYSDRLNNFYEDRTCIGINGDNIGCVYGWDKTNLGTSGVRGHFYYENGELQGLDDDTANTRVFKSDGIAIINQYLTDQPLQQLYLNPVNYNNPIWGFNNHPAFFIVYTPNCSLPQGDMPRSQSTCRRQAPNRGQPDYTEPIEFSAIPGYDHYAWTPAAGLSDSTIANPICNADSSGWYRVRMWNDDEDGACAQTIPVFLTVGKVPRPKSLQIIPSTCPANTGKIIFGGMDGKAPFQYTVNGETKNSSMFENLAPGSYELSVQDALGCLWDSTVVLDVNPFQTAAFSANPDSGYSPLKVVFHNQSTNATSYVWLMDGEPFSTSPNYTGYTFADTGTFTVALIAYRIDATCTDTAFATIRVAEGVKMIVPNIITPNNDGRNDALVAQTGGVAIMRWEVRNRWGNLLHSGEATNPPPALTLWSPEENQYPDGVYTVIITARGNSGEVKDFGVQVVLK